MSIESCPHCNNAVMDTDDGCDTERCRMRRAFVRQTVMHMRANSGLGNETPNHYYWDIAATLWADKPEGC
jgi:hypothetical protein